MHDPKQTHIDVVYRIVRYLKLAAGKGLCFTKHGHTLVEACTDADWAGSIIDRRTTIGYCTFVATPDNPNMKITTSLFNGQNYLAWSQSVRLFLNSREKLGYVNGRIKVPSTKDATYDKWEMENSAVMT